MPGHRYFLALKQNVVHKKHTHTSTRTRAHRYTPRKKNLEKEQLKNAA